METYFGEIEQVRGLLARERVLADLEALAREADELLKATAQDASDQAREARSRLAVVLERAKATCAQLREQAVANAKAAAQKTDATIREHLYATVGIAFVTGLLIGVLSARPNRHNRE